MGHEVTIILLVRVAFVPLLLVVCSSSIIIVVVLEMVVAVTHNRSIIRISISRGSLQPGDHISSIKLVGSVGWFLGGACN